MSQNAKYRLAVSQHNDFSSMPDYQKSWVDFTLEIFNADVSDLMLSAKDKIYIINCQAQKLTHTELVHGSRQGISRNKHVRKTVCFLTGRYKQSSKTQEVDNHQLNIYMSILRYKLDLPSTASWKSSLVLSHLNMINYLHDCALGKVVYDQEHVLELRPRTPLIMSTPIEPPERAEKRKFDQIQELQADDKQKKSTVSSLENTSDDYHGNQSVDDNDEEYFSDGRQEIELQTKSEDGPLFNADGVEHSPSNLDNNLVQEYDEEAVSEVLAKFTGYTTAVTLPWVRGNPIKTDPRQYVQNFLAHVEDEDSNKSKSPEESTAQIEDHEERHTQGDQRASNLVVQGPKSTPQSSTSKPAFDSAVLIESKLGKDSKEDHPSHSGEGGKDIRTTSWDFVSKDPSDMKVQNHKPSQRGDTHDVESNILLRQEAIRDCLSLLEYPTTGDHGQGPAYLRLSLMVWHELGFSYDSIIRAWEGLKHIFSKRIARKSSMLVTAPLYNEKHRRLYDVGQPGLIEDLREALDGLAMIPLASRSTSFMGMSMMVHRALCESRGINMDQLLEACKEEGAGELRENIAEYVIQLEDLLQIRGDDVLPFMVMMVWTAHDINPREVVEEWATTLA